jgi:hypothetical protein
MFALNLQERQAVVLPPIIIKWTTGGDVRQPKYYSNKKPRQPLQPVGKPRQKKGMITLVLGRFAGD